MGTEAVWAPYLIAALGAGAGAYNTYDTARRQDRVAAQGITQQAGRQRQVDARLNQEMGVLEASSPEAERGKALDEFLQQLRANRGAATGGVAVPGGSDRYQTDVNASQADIGNYGTRAAGILSRISAPGRQRTNEAISAGRTAADVGVIGRSASGDEFLNQLRYGNTVRNPGIDAFGQVAQGAGSAMATRTGMPMTKPPVPKKAIGFGK